MSLPFASQSLTFLRGNAGAYDSNGRWVPDAAPEEIVALGSLQPLRAHELVALPENRRSRAAYAFYTETELRSVTLKNPDRTTLDGAVFEVFSLEPWKVGFLDHYKAILCRVDDGVPVG